MWCAREVCNRQQIHLQLHSTAMPQQCRLLLLQGSSMLTARSNVDNFGNLTATQSAALAPLFADPQVCRAACQAAEHRRCARAGQARRMCAVFGTTAVGSHPALVPEHYRPNPRHGLPCFRAWQEEVTERGLLGLFYQREAADAKVGAELLRYQIDQSEHLGRSAAPSSTCRPRAHSALPTRCIPPPSQGVLLSAMQVRDREGRWQDVQLGEHEVAVCCGATLQHATAGLLRPAVHRVVGQPYGRGGGSGRRVLHFELRPRPAAVLDLQEQLAAAGHTVSARWGLLGYAACAGFHLRAPLLQVAAYGAAAALIHSCPPSVERRCRYSPLSVGSLMEQFDSLMSPGAAIATPDQQASGLGLKVEKQLGDVVIDTSAAQPRSPACRLPAAGGSGGSCGMAGASGWCHPEAVCSSCTLAA